MTSAGLLGKATSTSPLIPRLMTLDYLGHVYRYGVRKAMRDYIRPVSDAPADVAVILMVGTSMSAGKTTAGRVIIHELNDMGLASGWGCRHGGHGLSPRILLNGYSLFYRLGSDSIHPNCASSVVLACLTAQAARRYTLNHHSVMATLSEVGRTTELGRNQPGPGVRNRSGA